MAKKKPLRDSDSINRSLFLRAFFWAFPFLGFLGLFIYGIAGVIMAFFVSVVAALITLFAVNVLGGSGGKLFTGRRPIWKPHEQYAGLLDQARHHKTQKRFDKALQIINDLLKENPDFPEALYLKAQVLWEGFGNAHASKSCLRKVMELVPDKNDTIYRWAESLYKELAEVKARQ